MAGLQDYTIPKPGWSLKAGYTWDFSRKHHASVLFQTGHRVVSGENPLVRTLDIYPFSLSGEYSFSIFPWFSIGIQGGGGLFYSRISHYETVVDILTQNLSTTKGASAFISCMANANFSLFESSTNFMLGLGIECISEKEGLIPVPAFSLGLRCYPVRMWQYGKKPLIKEVEKIVEIEVPVERQVIIEKEVIKEVPSLPPLPENPFKETEFIVIYFDVKSTELSQEEISKLETLGKYLEKVPGAEIILEGNSAPFDSREQRYNMGLYRANAVKEYLTENYNIALRRISINSVGSQRSGGFVPGLANEAYSQYRTVRIFIVPGTDRQGQNPSPAQKEPEENLPDKKAGQDTPSLVSQEPPPPAEPENTELPGTVAKEPETIKNRKNSNPAPGEPQDSPAGQDFPAGSQPQIQNQEINTDTNTTTSTKTNANTTTDNQTNNGIKQITPAQGEEENEINKTL